ncbi:MAG: GNAT family N-acetyltransferase [Clostridia bacterium]|nr:GNAT family N-acetyltransferase [Clostridia bacterium]
MTEITKLKNRDCKKVIEAAIEGMHFDRYLDNKFLLKVYGKYFFYTELLRATNILAAYNDEGFAGLLLAEVYGREKAYTSCVKKMYIKLFDTIFGSYSSLYERARKELEKEYKKHSSPAGEITFLVVKCNMQNKGIGTLLLNELEKSLKGEEIFVHTDDVCTYQFYEKSGFDKKMQKDVAINTVNEKMSVSCLLYTKRI